MVLSFLILFYVFVRKLYTFAKQYLNTVLTKEKKKIIMKQSNRQKSPQSKIDILSDKIDKIFTDKGFPTPVWKYKEGCGVYIPKQKKKSKDI